MRFVFRLFCVTGSHLGFLYAAYSLPPCQRQMICWNHKLSRLVTTCHNFNIRMPPGRGGEEARAAEKVLYVHSPFNDTSLLVQCSDAPEKETLAVPVEQTLSNPQILLWSGCAGNGKVSIDKLNKKIWSLGCSILWSFDGFLQVLLPATPAT